MRRISFRGPANPYVTPDGKDWPDNGVRFARFRGWRPTSAWAPFRH